MVLRTQSPDMALGKKNSAALGGQVQNKEALDRARFFFATGKESGGLGLLGAGYK